MPWQSLRPAPCAAAAPRLEGLRPQAANPHGGAPQQRSGLHIYPTTWPACPNVPPRYPHSWKAACAHRHRHWTPASWPNGPFKKILPTTPKELISVRDKLSLLNMVLVDFVPAAMLQALSAQQQPALGSPRRMGGPDPAAAAAATPASATLPAL